MALILGLLLLLAAAGGRAAPPEPGRLRVQVSLVTLGVHVTDPAGRGVAGLQSRDFRLLEDGVSQPLAFFSSEEQPLSLGVLLDRSQSMGEAGKLSRAQAAARALIRSGRPDNELFFLPFNHTVPANPEFTTDWDRILRDVRATSAEGGTRLYDAVVSGLERLGTARHRRQALVVITDGADQLSHRPLDHVILRLRQSQVQVYLVGYFSPEDDETFRLGSPIVRLGDGTLIDNPRIAFGRLAAESGAEAFFPTSGDALRRVVDAITADLRTQYTLAYYPPAPDRAGRYRRIRVEVQREGVNVRFRPGYVLPAGAGEVPAS